LGDTAAPARALWAVYMPRSTSPDAQIRQLEPIAMRYLEKHGSINNRELRRLSDITYDQATYFFNRMLKAGRLLRTGRTAGTRYVRPENAQRYLFEVPTFANSHTRLNLPNKAD